MRLLLIFIVAFGLMARCLRAHQRRVSFEKILEGVEGVELCDSITGDGHKLLNVPYDCGFFFSRRLELATDVFQNAGAAYLKTPAVEDGADFIPSPLNIGIENSRRFRALPVYASLMAFGRTGYADILRRQIELARVIAHRISGLEYFELLPDSSSFDIEQVYIVVLFRAKEKRLNEQLVKRVNASKLIYVSGTSFQGQPAARIETSMKAGAPNNGRLENGGVKLLV